MSSTETFENLGAIKRPDETAAWLTIREHPARAVDGASLTRPGIETMRQPMRVWAHRGHRAAVVATCVHSAARGQSEVRIRLGSLSLGHCVL